MSEYIKTADNVYIRLNEFMDSFADEAELINGVKCQLVNYGSLDNFYLSKGLVLINEDGSNYQASYNGINLYLYVEDKMIVDYSIE